MLCYLVNGGTYSQYHRQRNNLYFKGNDIPNNK